MTVVSKENKVGALKLLREVKKYSFKESFDILKKSSYIKLYEGLSFDEAVQKVNDLRKFDVYVYYLKR
jgi:hypothetical protein